MDHLFLFTSRHSTPYAIPRYHRRSNFKKQDQSHVNTQREQKSPEREMKEKRQDETLGSWFKITVSVLEKFA